MKTHNFLQKLCRVGFSFTSLSQGMLSNLTPLCWGNDRSVNFVNRQYDNNINNIRSVNIDLIKTVIFLNGGGKDSAEEMTIQNVELHRLISILRKCMCP